MFLSRRALLLVGGGLALTACQAVTAAPAPIVGRPAPDFTANELPVGKLSLSDLAGKPVVLNFFATWCVPCRKELPAFQAASEKSTDKELSFVLIDMQEDPDDVAVFLDDLRVTLRAVVDSTGEIAKSYRVRALPSTFFIGRDRTIKMTQLGALDDKALEAGISKII